MKTIKAIAQKQPYYFVMRDSSLENDSVATNFEQIFATYSKEGALIWLRKKNYRFVAQQQNI